MDSAAYQAAVEKLVTPPNIKDIIVFKMKQSSKSIKIHSALVLYLYRDLVWAKAIDKSIVTMKKLIYIPSSRDFELRSRKWARVNLVYLYLNP